LSFELGVEGGGRDHLARHMTCHRVGVLGYLSGDEVLGLRPGRGDFSNTSYIT
jgi:hypothetical protein